ncbi:Imm26 family immunity protein [uncultured Marinobacter sp.]|uniref:Imm26 family immunity protein n=1 Tax=uncultured Marinobacter sp. TaxID=187379 RepID=UPI002634B21F|nr:Imm26 family immunity protein [uncultured Marinobacter sp.]
MRQRYRLGDIVKIQLDQSKFTYGQLLNDASIGVLNIVSVSEVEIEKLEGLDKVFYSGVFDTSIANKEWPVVGNILFEKEEDSWAPPEYIQDIINPNKYSIYYRGEMSPATKEQVIGLEKQVMRKPSELIDVLNNLFK